MSTHAYPILLAVAAALGPISHLPSLRRVIFGRTSDGMTGTLCGLGLVSYGGWLGLSTSVQPFMYAVVMTSAGLQIVTALYVRHWRRERWGVFFAYLVLASATGAAAVSYPALAVAGVLLIDGSWYYKAVADVVRSEAAKAVSTWGWVCSFSANMAWVLEAARVGDWRLFTQCAVLATASAVAGGATWMVHRRGGRNVAKMCETGNDAVTNEAVGGVRTRCAYMKARTINGGMQVTRSNLDTALQGDSGLDTEPARERPRERHTRRAISAVLVWLVAVFVVATANPFVWAERNEDLCDTWSEREIEYYQPSAATVLTAVADTPTYIVGDLPGEMHGIAIWGHTFLEADAQVDTMIHESIHQLQFRSEGVLPYAARYSSDMVHGLYAGCSLREAYLAVRYERQARDVVWRFPASILAVLGERNGSTIEEELWMLQRIGPTQVVEEAQRMMEDMEAAPQKTSWHPGELVVHKMHIEELQAAAAESGNR